MKPNIYSSSDYCGFESAEEIWKPVNCFEQSYQISTQGNIYSMERIITRPSGSYTKKGTLLTPIISNTGYLKIGLQLNKTRKMAYIHRLVAEAFIPNPENKPCVNHIDGNKLNNSVSNLEWCTYSENMKHGFKIGLYDMQKAVKNLTYRRKAA